MLCFNLHKSFYGDYLETRVGIIYIFLLENVYYNRGLPQKAEIWIHIDGKGHQDQPAYNFAVHFRQSGTDSSGASVDNICPFLF